MNLLSQVKEQVENQKAVLVDVRELYEWEMQHIPSAIHLPLSALSPDATVLPKDKTLYIFCMKGGRAMHAATLLKSYFSDVVPLLNPFDELFAIFS